MVNQNLMLSLFAPLQQKKYVIIFLLFVLPAFVYVFAPRELSLNFREMQTLTITENFAESGFSFDGMTADWFGDENPRWMFEFPIYNFLGGLIYLISGDAVIGSRLISLISWVLALLFLIKIMRRYYSDSIAFFAVCLITFSPVIYALRGTAQPDSLALCLILAAIDRFIVWKDSKKLKQFIFFLILLSLSALTKLNIIIPFAPVLLAAYFYDEGAFRIPRISEIVLGTAIFIVPVLLWFLYANAHSEPVAAASLGYVFINVSITVQPFLWVKAGGYFLFYVFALIGVPFFIIGLKKLSRVEYILVFSVPFYLALIGGGLKQPYYFAVLVPIVSLIAAKGIVQAQAWLSGRNRILKLLTGTTVTLHILLFLILSSYVTTRDYVVADSSRSLYTFAKKGEMSVNILAHNRFFETDFYYPHITYLSGIKGWNIALNDSIVQPENFLTAIDTKRQRGAVYCLITWYTPDLEPWQVQYFPFTKREPKYDGKALFALLKEKYTVLTEEKNFGIVKLSI